MHVCTHKEVGDISPPQHFTAAVLLDLSRWISTELGGVLVLGEGIYHSLQHLRLKKLRDSSINFPLGIMLQHCSNLSVPPGPWETAAWLLLEPRGQGARVSIIHAYRTVPVHMQRLRGSRRAFLSGHIALWSSPPAHSVTHKPIKTLQDSLGDFQAFCGFRQSCSLSPVHSGYPLLAVCSHHCLPASVQPAPLACCRLHQTNTNATY